MLEAFAVARDGLADRSHTPTSRPHQMAVAVEVRLVEFRELHPGWGASGGVFASPGAWLVFQFRYFASSRFRPRAWMTS